ncbi:MAG: MFS transporter [Quisquiliibacterium sp.]
MARQSMHWIRLPQLSNPQTAAQALYFTYFAIVGGFAPYVSLYYAQVGLTIAQIGLLAALAQVVRIFAPPIWGALLDRGTRRARLLRVSAAGALVGALLFKLAGGNYAAIALVLAFYTFASSAQIPLCESMALAVAAGDSGRYGTMRQWGSLGFILTVLLTGPLLDLIGIVQLPWVLVALCAVLLLVVRGVPEPLTLPPAREHIASAWARLREPALLAFFVSCFLMMFAHAAFYGFYSLYLERAGYSKTVIGLAWTVGVLAEILLFRVQRGLFERFGALRLLSASLLIAVLRFSLIGLVGAHPVAILATQLMHAATFGLHHSAVMSLLHRWFGQAQQGRAQAMYVTLGNGLGGGLGGIVASRLWEGFSPQMAFYGAALAALAGWVAVVVSRRFD